MALVLEIRDARGVVTLHRLNSPSLTIGRALTNDVILDDPFVDARHAQIVINAAGAHELIDTGSRNGILVGDLRITTQIVVEAGATVRLGRTTLRFRDLDEDVAPALADVDEAVSVAVVKPQHSLLPANPRWQWAVVIASLVAFAGNTWLNTWEREGETRAIAAVFTVAIPMFVWAAIWGASTRGADRKLNFRRHAAVIAAGTIVALLAAVIFEWWQFLFPDGDVIFALALVFFLVVVAAIVAEHLGVSTTMSHKRRWRAGFIVSVISFTVTAGIGMTMDTDRFTDVAEIIGNLKPINDKLVPAVTPLEFASDLKDLRQEVDSLLKK